MKSFKYSIIVCLLSFLLLVIPMLGLSPNRVKSQNRPDIEKPNVILIVADDMGVGDISSFNDGLSRTPNLDTLISESSYFTNAYSSSPVCGPARAALLTGRYPHRTGVVSLSQVRFPELTSLNLDETTLADIFQENGYKTGIVGKWHLGMGEEYLPLERGFQESIHFIGGPDVPDTYFDFRINVNGTYEHITDEYLTDYLTDRAIEFVNANQNEPFFLHLAHYAPHRPLSAPQNLIDQYMETGLNENTATVYAMNEVLDTGIGELISELQRLGIDDRTIILFTSDNGPDPFIGERFNVNLRGTKYEVYEGGLKVPFIANWPQTIDPAYNNRIITFIDVLPTLVELCQLEYESHLKKDGRSFANNLFDHTSYAEDMNTPHFWQWNRGTPDFTHNAAVRFGNWKLVRPIQTIRVPMEPSEERPRLYNLEEDPFEQQDISSDNFMQYEKMRVLLEIWSRKMNRSWEKGLE